MNTNTKLNPTILFPVFLTVGIALGLVIDHLSVGIGIGMLLYAPIGGAALAAARKRSAVEPAAPERG
ncbi:hypothetical protein [Nonomuraea typhae]|uniref:hypothetical protein n=1 Tax=Nonomuraea typhae TaxID=2603600 RepID=UPI0012F7B976|nr:hypothetical protein [Nonomuraea typhae]